MRRDVAQDHHDGAVGVHSLRRAEVADAFVCDDVGEVVLWREQVGQGVRTTWPLGGLVTSLAFTQQ